MHALQVSSLGKAPDVDRGVPDVSLCTGSQLDFVAMNIVPPDPNRRTLRLKVLAYHLLVTTPLDPKGTCCEALLDRITLSPEQSRKLPGRGEQCFVLTLDQSCHYLLNIFHALVTPPKQGIRALTFSRQDTNALCRQLCHNVLLAVCLCESGQRDMRIVAKVKQLMGMRGSACNIQAIMDVFATQGAQRLLSSVLIDQGGEEAKNLINYHRRWIEPGSAYSDKRYEMRTVTTMRKRCIGRGHVVNERVTYELPENVARVDVLMKAFAERPVFSYSDAKACVEAVNSAAANYRLGTHVRTYYVYSLDRDLAQLHQYLEALNPVPADTEAWQQGHNAAIGLAMIKKATHVYRDVLQLLVKALVAALTR